MNLRARVARIARLLPAPAHIERLPFDERLRRALRLIDQVLRELDSGGLCLMAGLEAGTTVWAPPWSHPDRCRVVLLCFPLNRTLAKLRADGYPTPTTCDDLRAFLIDAREAGLNLLARRGKKGRPHGDAAARPDQLR